jgi:hypothetical protein
VSRRGIVKTLTLNKTPHTSPLLNLKVGDWVEVRSRNEILATLDKDGCLENLPFMPEMLRYCGQRLRVFKRADKTCEYTRAWSIRRMKSAVHLEGVRCDGGGHDGCQASCLIFWKEAWLKRAANSGNVVSSKSLQKSPAPNSAHSICTIESLLAATRATSSDGETVFTCQATEVPKFTEYMSFWDPRQHFRDLRSGNLRSGLEGSSRGHRTLEMVLAVSRLVQASVIGLYNQVQDKRQGKRYPYIEGTAEKCSVERLNLQPGELVEVRSKEEIMATLDKSQRHRGLWFDSEMLPYCGGIYRVLRRVSRIVDEKTRKMVTMKTPCVVLEGVVCKSDYHRLCPRAIYPYWRENWLKRAVFSGAPASNEEVVECYKEKASVENNPAMSRA